MIDCSTETWREALRLVKAAYELPYGSPEQEAARAAAFAYLCQADSKRILQIAHLLQPGATLRSIQAALVPLERVDTRAKITDSEMGIRNTDVAKTETRAPIAVVADNIRSAFNAGGIFRTADFFGMEQLIFCGYSPVPPNPQVVKTALGADQNTPWSSEQDIRDVIDRLRQAGYRIYALETADVAQDIATFVPELPCALLLGNERFGLDPDVVASADAVLEIRSHGMKNSLNVVSAFSVAAAFLRTHV